MRTEQIDAELKAVYRNLAEGRVSAEAAGAAEAALHARRAGPGGGQGRPSRQSRPRAAGAAGGATAVPALFRPPSRPAREAVGLGRPVPLAREAKKQIEARVVALTARTEKGKAWGAITPKMQEVALALLWKYHNAATGLCIPSYQTIADAVGCSTDTVRRALVALQAAGVIAWTNRLKRIWDGARQRVLRSSNSYAFINPGPGDSSKSDKRGKPVFKPFSVPQGPLSRPSGPPVPGGKRHRRRRGTKSAARRGLLAEAAPDGTGAQSAATRRAAPIPAEGGIQGRQRQKNLVQKAAKPK